MIHEDGLSHDTVYPIEKKSCSYCGANLMPSNWPIPYMLENKPNAPSKFGRGQTGRVKISASNTPTPLIWPTWSMRVVQVFWKIGYFVESCLCSDRRWLGILHHSNLSFSKLCNFVASVPVLHWNIISIHIGNSLGRWLKRLKQVQLSILEIMEQNKANQAT